jgi:hypothetical protein
MEWWSNAGSLTELESSVNPQAGKPALQLAAKRLIQVGQSLSNRLCDAVPMKSRISSRNGSRCEKLITTFGTARLVRVTDGSAELRGGVPADQTMAKEWISLFMHETVLRFKKA